MRADMLTYVRSTLVLDDALLKKAKQRAAALGTTLSEVVNQALRDALSKTVESAPPFVMVTYGDPKQPVHREPAELAEILEDEDLGAVSRTRQS